MGKSDTEIAQQEIERDSLSAIISQMSAALLFAKSDARGPLETAIRNASGRLAVVEKKIKDYTIAKEGEARELVAKEVAVVAQEKNLNASEKKTFAGFMKEDFFTKADFGKLEEFYSKSWDRLSEHGRDEMSKRIWGGIRHGKYSFGDLPPKVREHEMERAYGAVTKQHGQSDGVSAIPEKDRQDFIRAYEAGKKDEAQKILERDSFKKNLFQRPESADRGHTVVTEKRGSEIAATEAKAIGASQEKSAPKTPLHGKDGNQDFSDLSFGGAKLVETNAQGTSADIPNARIASNGAGRSTPGG